MDERSSAFELLVDVHTRQTRYRDCVRGGSHRRGSAIGPSFVYALAILRGWGRLRRDEPYRGGTVRCAQDTYPMRGAGRVQRYMGRAGEDLEVRGGAGFVLRGRGDACRLRYAGLLEGESRTAVQYFVDILCLCVWC